MHELTFIPLRFAIALLALSTMTLAVGTTAHADAILATAPVLISNDCPLCSAVNVGSKPIASVTVEIIDTSNGLVWGGGSRTCTDLEPNAACRPGVGCIGSAEVYCRVTVKGSKKAIRAALTPDDETQGPIVALPAY